jgi:hypothetical protein
LDGRTKRNEIKSKESPAVAVDLYFETTAFWIVIADHKAGHALASGKHRKIWDFADGGARN